jgi:predicted flap endonuclease-1-like 5' DNA nuclease
VAEPAPAAADAEDAAAALEEFLRALTGGAKPAPAPAPGSELGPAAVLHFQRPASGAPGRDLDRLPGAGPGLVRALERAGLRRLADIAPLAPEELAARLGPIGRLVPAQAWIDAARAAPPA